jgi:hypothetical protein
MRILERLEALYDLDEPGSVDIIVGVVPADWMSDPGVTEPRYPHAAIVSVDSGAFIDTVVAHEIGHILGLPHNSPRRLGDAGAWVNSPRDFERRDMRYDIVRPERFVDVMDIDPIGSEGTWIDRANYRRIADALR